MPEVKPDSFYEPEEGSAEETEVDTTAFEQSPLTSAPVDEKDYGQPRINVSEADLNRSIPEPRFEAPPMQNEGTGAGVPPTGAAGPKKPQPEPAMNPDLQNLSTKEKKVAAEHLTEVILDSYEGLHTWVNTGLKIPERKLNRMQAEGKIDMNVVLPYEYGKYIRAGELIQEYNAQMVTALEVSPKFKQTVRPLLTDMLVSKGAGMTPAQMLIFEFSKDAGTKMFMFMNMKKQQRDMLNFIAEQTLALREMQQEDRLAILKQAEAAMVSPTQAANSFVETPPEKEKRARPAGSPPSGAPAATEHVEPPPVGQPLAQTPQENFPKAPPVSEGPAAGAKATDQAVRRSQSQPPPPKQAARKKEEKIMDVNNIDSTFDTIHEENLQAKESERQVLNSANRAKRTRVAPLTAGYGGGKKGAPTKEEREMRRRLAQQQIALKSDRADVAHAVEDAIVVEVSGTVHASPQDKDSEEPVIIGMPNVSEVGENINDVDL